MSRPAILVLADGSSFTGTAVGAEGVAVGEVVFNTAMTGYQEILTDPSYAGQMVTLTCPHIGNTGTNPEDEESGTVHARALLVRDVPVLHSNFRATESLQAYLKRRQVVAIANIDTRALTRHLRTHGAQAGCVIAGQNPDAAVALAEAKAFPGLAGMDMAREVTCAEPWQWTAGTWSLAAGHAVSGDTPGSLHGSDLHGPDRCVPVEQGFHVVAMDFGVKRNILRLLVDRGCRVTVVPATTTAHAIRELAPDGLFLSNGPCDPEPCDYAITTIRALLADRLPTFGICLGHQLLALASGARTIKMKFGHHGANHPVLDTTTGRVMISSQNHGFAVDAESLNENLAITHVSLFDQSLQGLRRLDVPAFSFQGHPEASPGPHDVQALFDHFISLMRTAEAGSAPVID